MNDQFVWYWRIQDFRKREGHKIGFEWERGGIPYTPLFSLWIHQCVGLI